MKGGCWNKILWVDLSENKIWEEKLPEDIIDNYLGGYGLGVKILFDRQKPKLPPFDPENILGFTVGPLIGTPAITGCRYTVVGKSPMTGTWGDSNSGGYFGPAFKKAGIDGIFIKGIAEKPVYILIRDGKASIHSAAHLWGKDTQQTADYLKEEYGEKAQIASIGEPGERRNLLATIMHDKHRAAARGGLAALMGSKNLKAVAVIGNLNVPIVDIQKAKEIRKAIIDDYKKNPGIAFFGKYGTMNRMAKVVPENDPPTKNYLGVGLDFPNPEKISDDAILAYQSKKYACWQCPIACGARTTIPEGPYQLEEGPKPEYETLGMLGSDLFINNIEAIIYANHLCDLHGLDTISVGGTIAFAMECYEKGYLTKKDTDGLDLSWGNHEAVVKLIKMMAKGEGFGNVLVDGSKKAAEKIGKETEQFAMHVHGQEVPAHDPRYAPSWGLLYKVDATPARHTQTGTACYELGLGLPGLDLGVKAAGYWNTPTGKYELKGRGFHCARVQNIWHAITQAGCCTFSFMRTDIHVWEKFINAIGGTNLTLDDLELIGARIATLRQAFNIREGLNVADFELPKRLWAEPLPRGPLANITIDLPSLVAEYYTAQGWDQQGRPTDARLKELGLENIIETIRQEV